MATNWGLQRTTDDKWFAGFSDAGEPQFGEKSSAQSFTHKAFAEGQLHLLNRFCAAHIELVEAQP
jgi:hypothetical protein